MVFVTVLVKAEYLTMRKMDFDDKDNERGEL